MVIPSSMLAAPEKGVCLPICQSGQLIHVAPEIDLPATSHGEVAFARQNRTPNVEQSHGDGSFLATGWTDHTCR